ncbi:MAG: hypothetical protein ACI4QL_02150, partial [Candidatus Fimimonas sp.]
MKDKKILLVSVLMVVCLLATVLCACQTEHKCNHVCDVCQKCLDNECTDEVCADKCLGHKLATPTVSLDGKVVSWAAVEHASGYEVYVNDELKATVTETSYTIDATLVGNYVVKVLAKAESEQYTDSEKSNEVTLTIVPTKLVAPTITLENKVVSWAAVEHASGYEVYV